MMRRYGAERAGQRDAVVTFYSCLAWTGPGRSRWMESFEPIGSYVQTHSVYEKRLRVPKSFKDRVDAMLAMKKTSGERLNADIELVREAKRLGYVEDGKTVAAGTRTF